jgi:hypothetical protein
MLLKNRRDILWFFLMLLSIKMNGIGHFMFNTNTPINKPKAQSLFDTMTLPVFIGPNVLLHNCKITMQQWVRMRMMGNIYEMCSENRLNSP